MFLISDAFAADAPAAGFMDGGGMSSIIFMVLIFAAFWLLMIRPQQKREKDRRKMIDAIQKNDEIMMASGICGRVVSLGDQYVQIQIAKAGKDDSPVVVTIQRAAIQAALPKGTVKSL